MAVGKEVGWCTGQATTGRIRGCFHKFLNWPPGVRTANGTALCH